MKMKRILSLVISTAMTLSAFSGMAMTSASAEEGETTPAETKVISWFAKAADGTPIEGVPDDGSADCATIEAGAKFMEGALTSMNSGKYKTLIDIATKFTDLSGNSVTAPEGLIGRVTPDKGTNDPDRAFKFTAPADGVLDVYVKVSNNKSFYIMPVSDYEALDKAVNEPWTNTTGSSQYKKISGPVKASTEYYLYSKGAGIDMFGVVFNEGAEYVPPVVETTAPATPAPVDPNSKSWTVSAGDIGRKAGDMLMGGLTLVSDNTGTEKYVTAEANGKIETTEDGKVVTGSALKFVAPSDGKLEVTMIDCGGTNEDGSVKSVTPVIYGVAEKINLFEYTTVEPKERVELSSDVTEGNTYYITATGTKGRFSAAKFTPAGGEATADPDVTTAPDNTEKPSGSEIAYKDGTATVKADGVTEGILIIASYDGIKLTNVETKPLVFENGSASVSNLALTNGTKLMAWKSIESMEPICPSYTVGGSSETAPPATTKPTDDPSGLPSDILWRADDPEFASTLAQTGATVKGLTVPSGLGDKGKKVSYTHVDGTEYTFTSQWSNFGSTTAFSFKPEQACIVTVVFNGNGSAGKSIEIMQGETLLGSHTASIENNAAAEVAEADVQDPSAGDVLIKGTGGNKNVAAIFVEYYDPNVIVNQTLSGKITYNGTLGLNGKTLVFKNIKTDAEFEMPYTGEDYSIELPQKATYTVYIKDNEDNICATLDTREVYLGKEAKTHNLNIADIVDANVTGEVVTHGLDLSGVTLTFTAKDDPSITANAVFSDIGDDKRIDTAASKLAVTLTPNHEYTVTASGIDGYTLSPLSQSYMMEAGDDKPFKNILFTKNLTPIAYKSTITVGADKDYKTIQEALNAVGTMTDRPVGPEGRVEIAIDPGTYVEQLQVKSPYVTLKAADPANRPTITFYYGVGYLYYSTDKGFYSEDKYVQQTELGTVDKWGPTVKVDAANFLAENIIFENSFNCRVTPEELKDGVTPAGPGWYGDVSNKPDRTVENYDAKTKTAVERASAIDLFAANFELYNCDFISSQDSFYTGANGYVKDCYIEGGTDYIFGGNSVVFEGCTLAWHGYSDQSVGGYITACKTSDSPKNGLNVNSNGYLMKDCTVANSKYYPNNKFAAGTWGRNWGGENCRVIFLDAKIAEGAVKPSGWTKMGGELSGSILFVNGVYAAADAEKATDLTAASDNPNGQMTQDDAAAIDPVSYFNDWIPKHYTGKLPEKTTYTTTWYFGKANGAPEYAFEGANGTTTITGASDAPTEMTMTVDATSGKFNNSSRTDEWCQVNTGTVFTIPVVNGSKISVNTYGNEAITAPRGAVITKNEPYTYAGEGGNVNFTVTSGGYIASIKVVSPITPEEYVPVLNNVTVTPSENGTVTTSVADGKAEAGSIVTITATPDNGYKVGEITVTKAGGGAVDVNDGKFTMPDEAVTVTVTFELKPTVQPSKIDYEMPFSTANGVIDGVTISSQQDYKLFDDFVTLKNMKYDNNHGAQGSGPIEIQVPGPVEITIGACAYNDCKISITDAAGNAVAVQDNFIGDAQNDASGNKGTYSCYGYNNGSVTLDYNGAATKLTISFEQATNGTAGNARFWLPYLRIKSTDETPVVPTTQPTGAPTTEPTTEPTTAPTAEPTTAPTTAPTEAPNKLTAVANDKVTADYSITESTDGGDTVYTFHTNAGKGVDGAGYSFDLSKLLGDNLYSKKGVMTVSMQFKLPDAAKKPSQDGYIDISSSSAYNNGADEAKFVRYNIYNGWDQFNYYGSGTTRVNGGIKFTNHTSDWYTLTATIDVTTKKSTIVTTAGSETATYNLTEFPTAAVDGKLYLNVIPTRSANDANEIEFLIKNITVSYEKAPDVIPASITAVNGTDDELKTTKLGGEVSVDKAAANAGETVTITTAPYYGFEVSAVKVAKDDTAAEAITADNGVYSFEVEAGVGDYAVTAEFTPSANKKILYFMDSTLINSGRIAKDNGIKLMNYVDNGTSTAWTAQSLQLDGKDPVSAKVVLTKNGTPSVTVSLNDTAVGSAQPLTLENEFRAAGTKFYTANLALTGATFTGNDKLGIEVTGEGGYLGNYWYMILEYAE